jgi:hypothetical protein
MADATPQHRVIGAMIYLRIATPEDPQLRAFYQDAHVPPDVSQEQIDHHLSVGLIEPIDAPARGRKTAGG